MKTIIAATDFSGSANNAVQFAAALALQTRSKLVLFNAFQLSVHATNSLISAAGMEEMFQSNKKELQSLADEITFQYGITTDIYTRNAFLQDALPAAVVEEKADLVVMGMHINDWGDRLFGNTTISLISSATFPLLIVPEKVAYKGIKKILYAYNATCVAAQNKLSALKDVAKSYGASVEVFHVDNGAGYNASKLEKPAYDIKVAHALDSVVHTYKDVAGRNVAQSIEQELADFGADLLAVVPHRGGLWSRLANKSVTRQLALQTPVPLLVLPNECSNSESTFE